MGDELLAGGNIKAADCLFHARHQGRTGAEFVDAETDQQRSKFNISRQLTAYTDPNAGGMGGINDGFEHAGDGGMGWIMQMRDAFISTIGSHQVLKQVIGADAEELHLLRQEVGNDCRAWHLDHGGPPSPLQAGIWHGGVPHDRRSSGT